LILLAIYAMLAYSVGLSALQKPMMMSSNDESAILRRNRTIITAIASALWLPTEHHGKQQRVFD
jgi:hypothetical protein